MSSRSRRAALLGAGLLSAVALLALMPAWSESTPDAPDPTTPPTVRPDSPPLASLLSSPAGFDTTALTAAVHHDAYLADRVMVRAQVGADIAQIAADHGGALFRQPGRSGWVAISVPAGTHIGSAVEAMRKDPRVVQAGPIGVVRGAGKSDSADPVDAQEKAHEAMKVSTSKVSSSITVAVIDSGVAYENYTDDGVTYAKASTLSDTTFRSPYDFVNDDAHANDDHMHGTHIASIIASQPQYSGDIRGVAPGVSIMPIKVLDATNTGNELDLIDGIWHAIDNDADIINLSLAFDETYVPSYSLQEALREAHAAGMVVIAAAGNDASDFVSWPAASPYVLAVAAACPEKKLADYSNTSPAIHVTGVGGCMNEDKDDDGFPDGLVGETIVSGDPSKTQYVLWAGTSQAAAMVSGTAARYVSSEDGSLSTVATVLQDTSTSVGNGGRDKGTGAGIPTHAKEDDLEDARSAGQYMVAVLPYLHRKASKKAKPAAIIHVMTKAGEPARDGEVWLTMRGSTNEANKCKLSDGMCHFIAGDEVKFDDDDALGWSFTVDAFVVDERNQIIEPAMFGTDGLEVLVGAMADNEDTEGLPLGIYWPENARPRSGVRTSEAFAFVDSGVGFASSPLGVLFTPGSFPSSALSTTTVDLDGVGFASSPLGLMNLTIIEFGGVGFSSSPMGGIGFASSPLGLSSFKLAVFDGVGFSSSPLGLDAFDIYAPGGSTVNIGGVGFSSSPLNLATGGAVGVDTDDTYIGDMLGDGGWTIGEGSFAVGTGLIGSSMVDTTPAAVGAGAGDGWEVLECD